MKKGLKKKLSILLIGLMVLMNLSSVFATAKAKGIAGAALPVIKPTTLQNVKYIYQQNVKKVDLSKYTEKDGAILPPAGSSISPGNILVDEFMKTAYYIQGKNSDGTLIMRKPTMSEVFENFDIPRQTVQYNESNIVDLQPSISNVRRGIVNPSNLGKITIKKIPVNDTSSSGIQTQKLMSLSSSKEKEDVEKALAGGWEYGFENSKLNAYYEDGTQINVTLSGKIKTKMAFDVDYSMFDGYEFNMTGGQIIGLRAALDATIKKEVYIPIVGIDIDFNIGGVRAGLFVVVGIDGKLTLVVAAEEGTSFSAGIKGNTCFGIPTSFKPYSDPHSYYSAECDPNGKVTAYAYLTPSITVHVLGIDVFKAEVRVGFKAYSIEEGPFLNYGVNAVAQFYVKVLGKGKSLINVDFPLFSRKKEAPPGGFYFYGDLCAFRDDAVVAVYKSKEAGDVVPDFIKDVFIDKLPYVGQVQLYYYKANNTTKEYRIINASLSVEDRGVLKYNFLADAGINVAKGDSYRIVIPGNAQAFSSNVFSTMPFKGIKLEKADFFNEIAFGQVQPFSSHRDMPGWALEEVRSEGKNEQIFYSNKPAVIKFIDPNNKIGMISQSTTTDDMGRFKIENFDIRPFRKAIPYINIDGFELEGTPIDTTPGIYCITGTDYLSNLIAETIITDKDGKESKVTVRSMDEIAKSEKIASEEYTSGDHILAVNEYGTKKIENTIDYNTNTYYVKDIDEIYGKAIVASKAGATVDLREMIMDSIKKQLVYSDHSIIPLSQENNSQIALFEGKINEAAKAALQDGQPMSSSHAYHRILVADEKYKAPSEQSRMPSINTIPSRRIIAPTNIEVNKGNFDDILNPMQQKGLDAVINLNMGGNSLTPLYAADSIYVDTKASIDIEGYKLFAEQADPWILKGEKPKTQGTTPSDKLKNEIASYMEEGILYFKRYVINPNEFSNTKLGTWRPTANTVKHEIIVDYAKGSMSIDGIKFNNLSRGSMVKGKLYLPAATLMRMMGGSLNLDSKTGNLTLTAAGRSINLNTSSKAAVIAGKTIALKSEIIGTPNSMSLSTAAISKMFGAGIRIDSKKSMATINFMGN